MNKKLFLGLGILLAVVLVSAYYIDVGVDTSISTAGICPVRERPYTVTFRVENFGNGTINTTMNATILDNGNVVYFDFDAYTLNYDEYEEWTVAGCVSKGTHNITSEIYSFTSGDQNSNNDYAIAGALI